MSSDVIGLYREKRPPRYGPWQPCATCGLESDGPYKDCIHCWLLAIEPEGEAN
jgi:hypothetical protein